MTGLNNSCISNSRPSTTRALLDSPTFLLAALAVCISFTFQILLPVVPVMAERRGPHGIAGAATFALFIGAVTGELTSPWLMRSRRSLHLLVGGQVVTALASLPYALSGVPIWGLLGAAYARGVGMGVAIVVSVALLSELTPPHRRGASIGYYGLALSLPGIFVPSIGVFLLAAGRADVDALIAFAASAVGAAIALRIPDRPTDVARAATNLLGALRRPGLLTVFGAFVITSCSFGGVITFAPVALPLDGLGSAATFFLVAGASRALFRWWAGVLGDRRPVRLLLAASMASCIAGLVALALHGNAGFVLAAALLYGGGYGAVQTAAFLALAQRGTAQDSGAVAALWNSGIDLGSSVGGSLIGVTAAHLGYASAAWVLPIVVVVATPLFLLRAPSPSTADPELSPLARG